MHLNKNTPNLKYHNGLRVVGFRARPAKRSGAAVGTGGYNGGNGAVSYVIPLAGGAAATAVPTLGQWALVLLALMLGGVAVVRLRRG